MTVFLLLMIVLATINIKHQQQENVRTQCKFKRVYLSQPKINLPDDELE